MSEGLRLLSSERLRFGSGRPAFATAGDTHRRRPRRAARVEVEDAAKARIDLGRGPQPRDAPGSVAPPEPATALRVRVPGEVRGRRRAHARSVGAGALRPRPGRRVPRRPRQTTLRRATGGRASRADRGRPSGVRARLGTRARSRTTRSARTPPSRLDTAPLPRHHRPTPPTQKPEAPRRVSEFFRSARGERERVGAKTKLAV